MIRGPNSGSPVYLGAALIATLVVAAYWPALHGGFLLDDNILLTENALIAASDGLYRFWATTDAVDYYPVSNSALWIEWRLWGLNPTGYHVVSLLLHIVESWLIWAILRTLEIRGAFFAALLFAVHPVNVESVAWIAQRKGLLAMLFALLSTHFYLKAQGAAARRWLALSLLAFTLAMLSKGSVVVLPPLLLLLTWWKRPLAKEDLWRIAPFFAAGAILLAVSLGIEARNAGVEPLRHATFLERLLGAGAVVWFYLSKALVPAHLIFIYPQWQIDSGRVLWWLPLLTAAATTGLLWWYRQSWGRPLLLAWVFFCVALVPVLGFTDVGFMQHSLVADHYQHLALIGVVGLIAAGWDCWYEHAPTPALAGAVLATAVLTFLAWQQSRLYVDAATLYSETLAKNPRSWLAHYNLGIIRAKAKRHGEAIGHYEEALRLKPGRAETLNSLGNALAASGRHEEAIRQYEAALRLRPEYADAYNNVAVALAGLGRLDEAIPVFQTSLRLEGNEPQTHYNFGNVLNRAGRLEEAVEQYRQTVQLKPDHVDAHYNLGTTLAQLQRLPEAIAALKTVTALAPDNAQAWANLAFSHAAMNDSTTAVAMAERALAVARSQGQLEIASRVDEWLSSYRSAP